VRAEQLGAVGDRLGHLGGAVRVAQRVEDVLLESSLPNPGPQLVRVHVGDTSRFHPDLTVDAGKLTFYRRINIAIIGDGGGSASDLTAE
jgi:hypothetical protein